MPYEGAYSAAECLQCTQGEYCSTQAMSATDGQCTAGYFCESGSTSAEQVRCFEDHYCPQGTLTMKMCDPGDYTEGTGAATCLDCPDGKYCRGTSTDNNCPNGYYCTDDRIFPCPANTYMASGDGASSSSECPACPAAYGCIAPNIRVDCAAGFYC
jgi:hypothetical protein